MTALRHLPAYAPTRRNRCRSRPVVPPHTPGAHASTASPSSRHSAVVLFAVPVWAWSNLLAHGIEHDLCWELAVMRPNGVLADEWRLARSHLATTSAQSLRKQTARSRTCSGAS